MVGSIVLATWGLNTYIIDLDIYSVITVSKLSELPENIDAFIIGCDADADDCLRQIRQNLHWAPYPVWTETAHPLADGIWADTPKIRDEIVSIRDRLDNVALVKRDDVLMATLHYLWARPEQRIRPLRDPRAHSMYRYPVLTSLCGTDELADLLLKRLMGYQLLYAEKLRDRVPLCPQCTSGHLVFAERCPACHSIDIEQSQAIHCFSCGNVGLEKNFRQTGQLICPNCNSQLRLIGSDYDRPVENWSCRDCGELFIETDNRAHCISCGHESEPFKLQQKSFSDWMLSDSGKQVCRHGHSQQAITLLDTLDLVRPEAFSFALGWLIRYAARYSDSPYSLVLVDIHNLDVLINHIGMAGALAQLDAFIEHFSAQLRSTDFLMRPQETQLWLALPRTTKAGQEAFLDKLKTWLAQQKYGNEFALEIRWAAYCSEGVQPVITDIEVVFEQLVGQLS